MRISPDHPLRRLFAGLVAKELLAEQEVAAYRANLSVDFVHVDHLYRIRNSRGKPVEEVGARGIKSGAGCTVV